MNWILTLRLRTKINLKLIHVGIINNNKKRRVFSCVFDFYKQSGTENKFKIEYERPQEGLGLSVVHWKSIN